MTATNDVHGTAPYKRHLTHYLPNRSARAGAIDATRPRARRLHTRRKNERECRAPDKPERKVPMSDVIGMRRLAPLRERRLRKVREVTQ
jgi:hypothetical protein